MLSDLRYRNAASAFLHEICIRLEADGEGKDFSDQVLSAFNEAFNNVSIHAYEAPGPLEILVELDPEFLAIELHDQGCPFDLEGVSLPDLEQLPESGLGIFIMRSFMSEVRYTPGSSGAKNILRMVRRLRGAHPSTPSVE